MIAILFIVLAGLYVIYEMNYDKALEKHKRQMKK